MVIVQMAGGLGNQLQQYSVYRKYVGMGVEARLDVSWFDKTALKSGVTHRQFALPRFDHMAYECCTDQEKAALIGTDGLAGKLRRKIAPGSIKWFHESLMYHPEIWEFDDMYLSGYFACEKYHADHLEDLKEQIRFPESGNPANRKLAEEMENCRSVSVHVRRGDYLSGDNDALFGNICTDAYYESAIAFVRRLAPDAHFYLFSDDTAYVREKYQGNEYTVVDINHGQDDFYDMWLMSHCRYNICANSTFSFWGARLNGHEDKIMIRPTLHRNNQVFVEREMRELWPAWRFISPEGELYC